MTCKLSQTTLHAYFDDELDPVAAAAFEAHLGACPECQSALEEIGSVRNRIRDGGLYHVAALELRQRIRRQLPDAPETTHPKISLRLFSRVAMAVAATAAVIALALLLTAPWKTQSSLAAELVDAHVRSLQPGHLTDVESTDQHTVKPWFDGKLDFIPPVADYADHGFPLRGGRLDVIDGKTVAALVYGRHKHLINLFIWPARIRTIFNAASGSRNGYQWITWQSGDMQFCLVSDVSPADLGELRSLIRE